MKQHLFSRGLALLLCLAMVVGFVPAGVFGGLMKVNAAPEKVDLDLNHSFETLDEEGKPVNWKFGVNDTMAVNTQDKVDGNNAVQINAAGSANVLQSYALPVNAGDQYELSIWVKRLSGESPIYAGIWFGKEPHKNYDNYCCNAVTIKEGAEWTEYKVSWGVYKDASYVWVEIGNYSGGNVSYLIDNITFKVNGEVVSSIKVDAPEEPEQPEEEKPAFVDFDLNWSFENVDENGIPTAWNTPKEGASLNTADKVEGNNALQIDAVAAAKVVQSYAIPVADAGDQYEATFRVKRLSGDSAIYMGIWFGKEPHKNYDNYCCNAVNAKADNEWNEYTVSWGVYKDASYMWLEIGNYSGATVSYLIDDITLKINGEVVKTIKVDAPEEPEETEPAATEPAAPAVVFEDDFSVFAVDGAAGSGPKDWELSETDTGNHTFITCNPYHGRPEMTLQAKAATAKSPAFAVIPGETYTVAFEGYKHIAGEQVGGYVELGFMDADGNVLATEKQPAGKTYNAWVAESLEAVAPEGAAKAYVAFGIAENADSFSVAALKVTGGAADAPEATEPETSEPEETEPADVDGNWSFENINADNEPINWVYGINDGASINTTDKVDGNNAIQIDALSKPNVLQSYVIPVKAGDKFEVSVWVKRLSGDATGYAGIWFGSAAHKNYDNYSAYSVPVADSNEWKEYTISANAYKDAPYMWVEIGNNSGKMLSYLVDKVTVKINGEVVDMIPTVQPEDPKPTDPTPTDPADPDASVKPEDPDDPNFSFEYVEGGKPINWKVTSGISIQKPADAPLGTNVLQIGANNSVELAKSQSFPVEPGKTYQLKVMARNVENIIGRIGLYMTDENGVYIDNACIVTVMDGTKTWKIYSVIALAPKDAVNMHIELWCPSGSTGVSQFDRVTLGEFEADIAEPWVPEPYDPPAIDDLTINTEYPRLFLNAEELATIKTYLNDEEKNVYGISWKGEFDSLIRLAEAFLVETQISQASNGGPAIMFEAYPVLLDPNDDYYDPIYIEASTQDGQLVEYPHLGYGCLLPASLQGRLETLSLAYALTGDTKYSDRAISYALQMCDWEWWGDKYWLDNYSPGSKVDASVAWATQGVAAVYDICYNQLTEEQKAKIETGIIEKGLEYLKYGPTDSIANGHLMIIGGALTGIAAIINEDNAQQLKPYMDHALTATSNAFGQYAYSGNTEGHYYTGYGLEYFLPGVVHFYRATGLAEFVEHSFLSEMLPYWTVMFAAPGSHAHPNYGDGGVAVQMKYPMALIAKMTDDPMANYFLVSTGSLGSAFQNLIYLNPNPTVEVPTDLVAVVDPIGYGVLRTGFADDDLMLTLKANNSVMGHNHYDQNAIFFNVAGSYIIADPGTGSYYSADRSFYTMKGHSTILVDGNPQSTQGTGSNKEVFTSKLYGYIVGSAPNAYGADYDGQILEKFDRHAIQLNHEERAYYIVIDDLLSTQERIYGWQMYNGDRVGFEVDGEMVPEMTTAHGNNVSMVVGSHELKLNFIDKDGLDMADKIYGADGYTFVASSAATKAHQFMAVISADTVLGRDYINFASKLSGSSTDLERNEEGEICWKTSKAPGPVMVKSNSNGTLSTIFFRGGAVGDYIKVPFEIEEDGVYDLTLILGVSDGNCEIRTYIDDVSVSEVVDCCGLPETSKNIEHEGVELKAGLHYVTYEVAGVSKSPDYADKEAVQNGTTPSFLFINIGGMIMNRTDIDAGNDTDEVVVKETYDDENVLGALISYAAGKEDLVMFNRTDALVAAGKLSTDGQQAAVLGLADGKITEGFAATKATTLVYDGITLFSAEEILNIVADADGWHVDTLLAQEITLNVGEGDLVITVNGEKVDTAIENGMLTLALEAGVTDIAVEAPEVEDPTDPSEPVDPSEPEDPTDPSEPEGGDDDDNTQTGDNAAIAAMTTLLVIAMSAIALVVTKRRLF